MFCVFSEDFCFFLFFKMICNCLLEHFYYSCLSSSAWASIIKYHRLRGLHKRNLFFHSFGDWMSMIRLSAWSGSGKSSPLCLQTTTFLLFPHMAGERGRERKRERVWTAVWGLETRPWSTHLDGNLRHLHKSRPSKGWMRINPPTVQKLLCLNPDCRGSGGGGGGRARDWERERERGWFPREYRSW